MKKPEKKTEPVSLRTTKTPKTFHSAQQVFEHYIPNYPRPKPPRIRVIFAGVVLIAGAVYCQW